MAVTPSSTRIGLAVYLCRATAGWTPELRKEFFGFLDGLSQAEGGHSLKGFVRNIRKESLAAAPEAERAALEEIAPATKGADGKADIKAADAKCAELYARPETFRRSIGALPVEPDQRIQILRGPRVQRVVGAGQGVLLGVCDRGAADDLPLQRR